MAMPANLTLAIRLFGSFEARVNDCPLPRLRTRKGQQVLALLVMRRDRETERAGLAELLWPDSDSTAALDNLRRCLTDLRRALGPEARRLHARSPRTLRLDLSEAWVDLVEFDEAVSSADTVRLEHAVKLYCAPLVESWDDEWAMPERDEREEACLRALEVLSARAIGLGETQKAISFLRRAVALNPLRESAQCALLQALASCGDFASATVVYREFRERLHREMHAEPAETTTALYRRMQALQHGRGAPKYPFNGSGSGERDSRAACRMPLRSTPFVGREKEVREVSACIGIYRAVTLTGPGGIGKTRLAIVVAQAVAPAFADGARFIDLSATTASAGVASAFAAALHVREVAHQSVKQALIDRLGQRTALLVVDNCEQVCEACADLLQSLMEACPELRLLATSREPLGLGDERVWRVPGLSVPHSDSGGVRVHHRVSSHVEFDAVCLFLARASFVKPNFEMDARTKSAVDEICLALEGNPLSIELAAALTGHMPVSEIARRLGDRLTTLTGCPGSSPLRHQSLRTTLDWSYSLLSEPQRALLCAMSVFAGGWTLKAAEAVFAAVGGDRACVVELADGLFSKSLLTCDERKEEARYRLHEAVRQYAHERLADNGGVTSARDTHAEYFLAMAEEAADLLQTRRQIERLSILDLEHDNMLVALAWCREAVNQNTLYLAIAGALARYWSLRSQVRAGREWLNDALRRCSGGEPTESYARALNGAGLLTYRLGEYTESLMHHQQALIIGRRLNDNQAILDSMVGLSRVYTMLSDYDVADGYTDEALRLSRVLKNRFAEANLLLNSGGTAKNRGAYREAASKLEEALRISREIGVETLEAIILHNLGNAIKDSGDTCGSRAYYERSLSIHRRTGDRHFQGTNLFELAEVVRSEDDGSAGSASRCLMEESLALCRDTGNMMIEAACLHVLGSWALEQGDVEEALPLHRSALAIRHQLGTRREIAHSLSAIGRMCALREMPEDAARLWGSEAALREVIRAPISDRESAYHRQLHGMARDACPPGAFESAWRQGDAMELNKAVEYALAVTADLLNEAGARAH